MTGAGVLTGQASPAPAPAATRSPGSVLLTEGAGLGVAVALALVAVLHLASTDRSWILFTDGDSVLPALLRGSLAVGERQDWALSSVLFAPEFALYLAIAALGLGVRATLAVNAVANLVLLYAAVRTVAALLGRGRRAGQVVGALLAVGVFDALTLADSSAAWDSLELPSLLATTTYYSGTVLATVVSAGLVAAILEGRRPAVLAVVLGTVTAASVCTNPLFLAWAALPLTAATGILLVRRLIGARATVPVVAALAAGAVAGFVARAPLSGLLVKDPLEYARPDAAAGTAVYTLRLFVERAASPAGAIALTVTIALVLTAAVLSREAVRARRTAPALIALFAWVAPVSAVLGTVLAGAAAARYLQPLVFAPILPLAMTPLPARLTALRPRLRVAAIAVVTGTALLAAVPLGLLTATPDAAVTCLDHWITASGRTGAGLFQTIRGPKAYLPDPRLLIQVDERLHEQPWLTDRADYDGAAVSFLVTDSTTPSLAVPASVTVRPSVQRCGRYRILDFGAAVVPVLPSGPITPPRPPTTAAFE